MLSVYASVELFLIAVFRVLIRLTSSVCVCEGDVCVCVGGGGGGGLVSVYISLNAACRFLIEASM